MRYVYAHGLGQSADSWKRDGAPKESVFVDLAQLLQGKEADYNALYAAFSAVCDEQEGQIVLCGLSVGGVLALNYAIDHPQKVRALALIAAQYKMPKLLLKMQNVLFRCMPKAAFARTGFGKSDFLRLCGSMVQLDFSGTLQSVACPALIVCGEKDSANRKASAALARRLPNAVYQEIAGAGHEVNTQAPNRLGQVLAEFYRNIEK